MKKKKADSNNAPSRDLTSLIVNELRSHLPPTRLQAGGPGRPVAILGVHGISPIQRYAFQDRVADGLLSFLNAIESANNTRLRWQQTVFWPQIEKTPGMPELKPTAIRLYRSDEPKPDAPATRVYDVYEGYWSPLTKGKTSIFSLLMWLLGCTFLATSSTTVIPGSVGKVIWDVLYVLGALVAALIFVIVAFVSGVVAWPRFVDPFIQHATPGGSAAGGSSSFYGFAFAPFADITKLPIFAYIHLALIVAIGYFVVQFCAIVRVRLTTGFRTRRLIVNDHGRFAKATISARRFHRYATFFALLGVVAFAAADGAFLEWLKRMAWITDPGHEVTAGLMVVLAVVFIQLARYVADYVVEDVLGDVQVYTTHDCNAAFYGIRAAVLDAVMKPLLGILQAANRHTGNSGSTSTPLYEKVHIMGHSLGSTIALDVLIRARQLQNEGAMDPSDWERIRSFTTFGTALEKTKFFFDVRHPSVSAAQDQWSNDVYGQLFTDKQSTLAGQTNAKGIYWSNHWYFHDIVANEIVTYKSDVAPGARLSSFVLFAATNQLDICSNNMIVHPTAFYRFVHGDYLNDEKFWLAAGGVLSG